uniref:WWamide-3 n=1 Tax=Lissachatina fulica TaxID=2315439 RepID=WWA3_LISFU|nr:RecName: Full=WWamide-3 [Lissachatina fulica]AAB26827.1 WWamide-1=neuromodulatory peptide [Achatina fulica=African giant snails, ganglia, Peptide, 7 aa] [Lissachatina fulica]
WKEMSVW